MEKCTSHLKCVEKPPNTSAVESAKSVLPVKAEQKYNVDFLTEATKLLSTAWHKGEDMSIVKMKLNRQEKVKGRPGFGTKVS